jgi:hypothetical protein
VSKPCPFHVRTCPDNVLTLSTSPFTPIHIMTIQEAFHAWLNTCPATDYELLSVGDDCITYTFRFPHDRATSNHRKYALTDHDIDRYISEYDPDRFLEDEKKDQTDFLYAIIYAQEKVIKESKYAAEYTADQIDFLSDIADEQEKIMREEMSAPTMECPIGTHS